MKKLFNSRFLIILASSLIVLIGLTIGAFYLFDDVDDSFVKSGYVLNPLASTSEKYFFEENVGYKENLSSMIEFRDVDDKKVSVVRDSFVHYDDKSLSFLKNGAILDLDSLKKDTAVSFYNITDESIVERKGDGYIVESSNGDISLNNFIGRISDNKYIVVGNLNLKMAGNATSTKGEYFEVVYVEEGIVNIENKDVKYQVAAAGTQIFVGSNKVIDLGDKKITVDNEDVMSITAITIDGDENIEIIPKAKEDDETDDGNGNDGQNAGTENLPGNNEVGGEGDGGTGNNTVDGEVVKELIVSLKNADIGSTSVAVTFDILNATEEDSFKLQVVNLSSGRTIDMIAQVLPDVEIYVNLLSPNTKYLFMVINEKDNNKYFQKVFETTNFGIKLEKSYATENALAFKVVIEEGTDITNAKLSLYKFNDSTMQNEIVKTSYTDSITGETIYEDKIFNLSDFGEKLVGEYEIVFDSLDNDTIYTAVLDEFSLESSNFKDIYNVTVTTMTLKRTPAFSEMTVEKDEGDGSFQLSLGSIADPDNAIVSYTYMIYDMFDNQLAIDPIVHTNASPLKVNIGDDKNELKNDINYYYKVIIEYYDNEKYIEYVTSDSIIFNMGSEPWITVVPDESLISYDQIGGTIYLTDNSCLITIPGRKCSGISSSRLILNRTDFSDYENCEENQECGTNVYNELVDWEVNGDEIKAQFLITGLDAGTTYRIDIRDVLNDNESGEPEKLEHTSESKKLISTKAFTAFTANWDRKNGVQERPIVASTQLVAVENSGTLSPDESAAAIEEIVLKLYDGRKSEYNPTTSNDIVTKRYYNTDSFNIKEEFYDKVFQITNDGTFGLNAAVLAAKSSGGKLNRYYTIVMEAYTAEGKKLKLIDDVWEYRVSQSLFVDAKVELTSTKPIVNKSAGIDGGKLYPNLGENATVGYELSFYYERSVLVDADEPLTPKKINYYVYDKNNNKIDFFAKNEDGVLERTSEYSVDISKNTENNHSFIFYLSEQATPYEVVDDVFSRGNEYYIGFEMEVEAADRTTSLYPDPSLSGGFSPSGYGLYAPIETEKQEPILTSYIASSTSNSVTYKYILSDPDNAVYKEEDTAEWGFYYSVNNSVEKKINMTKVSSDDEFNRFEGSVTIPSLSKGDLYSLYYKRNLIKNIDFNESVKPYKLVGGVTETRLFDGFYKVENSSDYNFKYQIINNPVVDNKVRIKILADKTLFDRILGYKVTLTPQDSKQNPLVKKLWRLTSCNDQDTESRCLSVDYSEFKWMKTSGNDKNLISVKVEAMFDNGLTGYDLANAVASGESEYEFLILQRIKQDGEKPEGLINYLSYTLKEGLITEWDNDDALTIPRGYYTYKLSSNNKTITYYSKHLHEDKLDDFGNIKKDEKPLQTDYNKNISVALGYDGYYSDKYNGTIIPKMVTKKEMECSSNNNGGIPCDAFYFTSITPSVKTGGNRETKTLSIINGGIVKLDLDSTVVADIKKESDGNRYLYVDVWDSKIEAETNNYDAKVRPTARVKLDTEDSVVNNTIYEVTLDGLKENTTYYYNVYAYLKKGENYLYTQLYNSNEGSNGLEQTVVTYDFDSLKTSDLFKGFTASGSLNSKEYGVRLLTTNVSLGQYGQGKGYNFDFIYVFCEYEDYVNGTCGVSGSGKNNIFEKTKLKDEISTKMDFNDDVAKYNVEYGKKYAIMYFARTDYYDPENNLEKVYRDIEISKHYQGMQLSANEYARTSFVLPELNAPAFIVTKEAYLENGTSGIEFTITVDDVDKTLVDGKYFVKLVNSNGNVVGSLELTDEEGNSYEISDYQNYAFDAKIMNNITAKKIRIVDLEPESIYKFEVSGEAYLNNYGKTYNDEDGDYILPDGKVVSKKKIMFVKTEPPITAYSTDKYGVAFGSPSFDALNANVINVQFLGGSSLKDNVLEVHYTVAQWDDESNLYSKSGTLTKGVDLEFNHNTSLDQYYLDISGLNLTKDVTYNITLDFVVKDNPNWISFTGQVRYGDETKK